MRDHIFFAELPKIEVHAHLNGSMSNRTLKTLLEKQTTEKHMQSREFVSKFTVEFLNFNYTEVIVIVFHLVSMVDKQDKTMEECFRVFKLIHELVTSTEVLLHDLCN